MSHRRSKLRLTRATRRFIANISNSIMLCSAQNRVKVKKLRRIRDRHTILPEAQTATPSARTRTTTRALRLSNRPKRVFFAPLSKRLAFQASLESNLCLPSEAPQSEGFLQPSYLEIKQCTKRTTIIVYHIFVFWSKNNALILLKSPF